MTDIIEAIYENGSFRPVRSPGLAERQRVRLHIEPVPEADADRKWGTYESLAKTFEELDSGGFIDEKEWAEFEAEQKRLDIEDTLKTAAEVRRLNINRA